MNIKKNKSFVLLPLIFLFIGGLGLLWRLGNRVSNDVWQTPQFDQGRYLPAGTLSSARALLFGDKIDVNTARVSDLAAIDGISVKMARKIIVWREKNGDFLRLEGLRQLNGIGKKTVIKLAGQLKVVQAREFCLNRDGQN